VADPASVRAGPGAGRFVREGIDVLRASGRVGGGDAVVLDDRLMNGRGVLMPPADPVLLGAVNRALAARGIAWRFGEMRSGEWQLGDEIGVAADVAVTRRHRLEGTGQVLATVGGEPWLVRDGDLVIVGSRLEENWTALPISAGFVPFLDLLLNELATTGALMVPASPGATAQLPATVRALQTRDGPVAVPPDGQVAAPLTLGVYFLTAASGDTVGALEVNHDARESLLRQADRRALRATLGAEVQLLDDEDLEAEMFRGTRRADLSSLLIIATLLAALAELGIATAGGRLESSG
jgi:hypothetical protein